MSDGTNCFNYLVDNIPAWLASLEDVRRKMEEKQKEIALIPAPVQKQKQKTGSMESLRPQDESGAADAPSATPALIDGEDPQQNSHRGNHRPQSPPDECATPPYGHYHHFANRKRKTPSVLSGRLSGPSKYRTRSMIIVYYDSEVEKAFETLVRNIGTGRNLLRKGRMAARVEALTKAAPPSDGEDSNSDGDGDDDGDIDDIMAKLHYRPTRMMFTSTRAGRGINVRGVSNGRSPLPGSRGRDGGAAAADPAATFDQKFDAADAALESAQSFCERAAHQFLRDGDCRDEIDKAAAKFGDALALSRREVSAAEAAKVAKAPGSNGGAGDEAAVNGGGNGSGGCGGGGGNGERNVNVETATSSSTGSTPTIAASIGPEPAVGVGGMGVGAGGVGKDKGVVDIVNAPLEVGDDDDSDAEDDLPLSIPPALRMRMAARR